jgi:hypothetical protein
VRSLARAALATASARGRAIVALVAAPLALAAIAGVVAGVLTERAGFGGIAILAAIPLAIAGALIAGRALLSAATSVRRTHRARWLANKLEPLRLEVTADAPARVEIIHPAIDLQHFFGGFIAVFNLARRLAERGHRVRLIALEGSPPRDWRSRLASYEGIGASADDLEVVFAADRRRPIEISPADSLIATHFTAAHVAAAALERVRAERFLYLIQEYEPFIFPMGSAAALARQSYDLPHTALFSTALLRDWFAAERIGVFAGGADEGELLAASFDNAITPVGPVTAEALRRPGPRRLLFYARPEEHAARNLFELGAMALDRALAAGRFAGWALAGVGTVEPGAGTLRLPESGAAIELLPRGGQADYARLLASFDVGLALMHTPHPSLVPIEMAAAGMPTVTSAFANKDGAALARISSNLIGAEPTVAGIAAALALAEGRADDLEGRAAGSRVGWPSSWDEALDDAVIDRVERLAGIAAATTAAPRSAAPRG